MGENNGNGSQAQNVKKVKDLLKIQKKKNIENQNGEVEPPHECFRVYRIANKWFPTMSPNWLKLLRTNNIRLMFAATLPYIQWIIYNVCRKCHDLP